MDMVNALLCTRSMMEYSGDVASAARLKLTRQHSDNLHKGLAHKSYQGLRNQAANEGTRQAHEPLLTTAIRSPL